MLNHKLKLYNIFIYIHTKYSKFDHTEMIFEGGPAQSSRKINSRLSGNTPHKVGEERSKESKSESGDFGHDHFLPTAYQHTSTSGNKQKPALQGDTSHGTPYTCKDQGSRGKPV